ncbi:aldehyde dehydrogenase (NADP(+)) [Flavobacterium oreochromis]|uniref:Aldehyde dehydrogenase (NADP(+)) n=2 Tax=Flavobacterium TaxID=237 RepID=A0A2D0AI54_9FLAO|nr:aldehyde dehydrogenase (NADP(+)) [Flavobacterium oreochromis]OWP74806.1 aldehyde dehydrogenase (NADP(+)) [Flavobacterium oreochromis]OWP79506.1 aldehyde dehydrogenase (NADP(+)) [Flavobacterium oreochromis]QYS87748.1 aldehyde dehydrogenase (NADP(+)) [Flavobacterium oreochromis]
MITGKNYIGTNLVAGGTKVLKTFNPELNQENSWDFIEATTEEIEQAVQLANKAYQEYKNVSGKRKALFLNAIADEILALGDTLLEVYVQESGLPRGRAEGERGRTIGQLRAFAQMLEEGSWVEATIDTAIPDRQPLPKIDLRKMLYPLGPVVVFGSSNFPFAFSTAGGDTASALAAGCPVIVKSHSMHIGTGEMIASAVIKAVQKTGMPEGVFSNLIGEGTALGTILVKHPLVKAVGFTGSIAGGRALFDLASQRSEPIPVFAEMGSINPVILLPNELKNNTSFWAKQYASSITLGAGQFCTNPGLIIALKTPELNDFVAELASEILQIPPSCMLHHLIRKNYGEGKQELSSQKGVEVLATYQGEIKANYAPQTILQVSATEFLNNKTLSHEVFGPFSILVICESKEQMTHVITNLEGQLTGTIIAESEELQEYKEVIEALKGRVGRLIFNGVPTGVEVCASMLHGGPYPASSDSRFTAVGIHAVKRWVRPVSYQNWPNELLPDELKDENPLGISRTVNDKLEIATVSIIA